MISPCRSRIAPRGGVSEMGRRRLVSALSWNLSCWMIWVRKNAPDSTRNAPTRIHRATSARSRTRYESKPFISRVQPDREPFAERQQHDQREERGGERLQRAVHGELGQERPVPGAARRQYEAVAEPQPARHERRVHQQVVGEE